MFMKRVRADIDDLPICLYFALEPIHKSSRYLNLIISSSNRVTVEGDKRG